MKDGSRTRDTQSHNLVLYQLSYFHHITGGLGQTRTADLLITNEVHYLLCYETE